MAKGFLYLKVDPDSASAFSAAMDQALADGWRRDHEWENRSRAHAPRSDAELYYYACDSRPDRPAAGLCLYRKDGETLYVSNIIPLDETKSELTDQEYNAIQRDFLNLVKRTSFPAYVTGETAKLILSAAAEEKLMTFNSYANRSTGSGHPTDRKNWIDFLITAHRDRCLPDSTALHQYLVETLQWPPDKATELACELEFAKDIFDHPS